MVEKMHLTRAERIEAYEKAVGILRENALIFSGSGGVLTIIHPDTQDKEGVTEKCLRMAMAVEIPPENVGTTDDF